MTTMTRWARATLGGAALLSLTTGGLAVPPAAAVTTSGCEVGAASPDAALEASSDLVSGGVVDILPPAESPVLSTTFVVRSLQPDASLPPGVVSQSWTMDFTNNIGNNPGGPPVFLNHPYVQVVRDATGWSGTMGFLRAGVRTPWQPVAVTVNPGTPGVIQVTRDTSTFGIPAHAPLQNFHTTSEVITASGAAVVDEVGPFSSAYLADVSIHGCVDFALPAQPTARRAADFLDSIGVNTHLDFLGFRDSSTFPIAGVTPPETWYKVERALLDLGIKHIRETKSSEPQVYEELKRLGALGVKTNLVFWQPSEMPSGAEAAAYVKSLLPAIGAVEGTNEPVDGTEQIENAKRFQRELWEAMQSDPATRDIPVGTPAPNVAMPQTWDHLGDLSAYASYGALHAYPGTEPMSRQLYLERMLDIQRTVSGSLPVWVTEAGWDNFASGWYQGTAAAGTIPEIDYSVSTSVSERAGAAYVPKMFFTHFAAGIDRTYMYELMDEGAYSVPTAEDFYGLIRYDGSPKPVYHRMKTLNRLLRDSGTVTTAGSLAHTVSTPEVQHLLLEKSDGSFWLALWTDDRLYSPEPAADTPHPHDLHPPATTTTVSLERAMKADQFQLASGTSPVRSFANGTQFEVQVQADDVTLIRLTRPGRP